MYNIIYILFEHVSISKTAIYFIYSVVHVSLFVLIECKSRQLLD